MSAEDVERALRVIQEGNETGWDGATARYSVPDVRHHIFPEWPGEKVYEGHEGLRRLLREWTEHFDEFRWEVEEVIDLDGRLVLLSRIRGFMRGTDVPVDQEHGTVIEVRGELFGDAWYFLSWDEARAEAGLPPAS